MVLEYHDTMVPSHEYGNIGNDTAKWDDGWFSDTVHARRFEGDLIEVDDVVIYGTLTGYDDWFILADDKSLYFGAANDAAIYYSGDNLVIDPKVVGTGGLAMPVGSKFAIGIAGGIDETREVGCDVYHTNVDLTKTGRGIASDFQFGPAGAGNTNYAQYAFYYRCDTNASWSGNHTTTGIYGMYGIFRHQGTGSVENAYGANCRIFIRPGAGNITNAFGVKLELVDQSAAGSFTNTYGIQIIGAGLGTTSAYAIHADGGMTYLPGNIGTGTGPTIPGEQLVVDGNIHLYTDSNVIYFGTGKDATIKYDGTNMIVKPDVVGTGAVQIEGDMLFSGAGTGLPYGEIYAYNVDDTIDLVAGVANKVQITSFTTNGVSNLTTPAHGTDDITIVKTGVYRVTVFMHVESDAGGARQVGFGLWKNNGTTQFTNVHSHQDFAGGGGETHSVSMGGLVSLTAADTVEVWCWNETGTDDIIMDDITLSITMVGG